MYRWITLDETIPDMDDNRHPATVFYAVDEGENTVVEYKVSFHYGYAQASIEFLTEMVQNLIMYIDPEGWRLKFESRLIIE